MMKHKPVVGLAGGIGSGKSEVGRILQSLGGGLVSSDEINRQLLATQEIKRIVVAWWGAQILNPAGEIDRARIADIVFDDPVERIRLEQLMHPRIDQRRAELFDEMQRRSDVRILVLDAPLLFEARLDRHCDAVIFVSADLAQRAERARIGRGWSLDELLRREKFQWPLDKKQSSADYVVNNNSDLAALRLQVEAIFSQIVASAESDP